MHWNINYTKTVMRPGEDLGFDCKADDNGVQVDLRPYSITVILRIGAAVMYTAATNGTSPVLPLYSSPSRKSVFLNLSSEQTKKFCEGVLNIEIMVRNDVSGEIVDVVSEDTVNIIASALTGVV